MTVWRRGSAKKVLMWSGWAALVLIVAISLGTLHASLGGLSLVAFGVGVPVALRQRNRSRDRDGERQLLSVLSDRGQLTPMTAALRTSLTVEEAGDMLEDLTSKGHVEARSYDGVLAYCLTGKDLPGTQVLTPSFPEESSEIPQFVGLESARPLSEPPGASPNGLLSDRELEVLRLLASGRSNKEIAGDLFLALGTVKNHTSNVYRKLGAKNRADALVQARQLGLL